MRLPRLRVVPFLGLAVVHRCGAVGAAWSMWSTTEFLRKNTVRGEADSWVHGSRKEVPPYYAQNNYSSTWQRGHTGWATVFREKMIRPLTAGTHELHLHTQGSASGKKMIRPPDCWDPPATSSHARKCVQKKSIRPPDCWDPPATPSHARKCVWAKNESPP